MNTLSYGGKSVEEQTTDLWSFNSGRVQEKMGVNEKSFPEKTPVSFVLLDNSHLTEHGIRYFCARSKQFVLITTNKNHPAFHVKEDNLHVLYQNTSTLIDGRAVLHVNELDQLGVLSLDGCEILENSYIRLKYKVIS